MISFSSFRLGGVTYDTGITPSSLRFPGVLVAGVALRAVRITVRVAGEHVVTGRAFTLSEELIDISSAL